MTGVDTACPVVWEGSNWISVGPYPDCLIFATLLGTTQTSQANSFQLWASSMTLCSPAGPETAMNATYAYDFVGNVLRETHGNGQAITHEYDRLNRRIFSNDGIGNITRMRYDANGNLLSSDDGNGHETSFTYNNLNQKITANYPELRGTSRTPSAWGELLSETDARGNATSYQVDAAGWRTSITRPGLPR